MEPDAKPTLLKGKVTQIIKHDKKSKYCLSKELNDSDKNVIVISTNPPKNIVERIWRLFHVKTDSVVVLVHNINFKVGDYVELKVKPLWIKTDLCELVEGE